MKHALHANCGICPLRADANTQVPSVGPSNPKLIVVGEGPGKDEAFSKTPFVGVAGKMLRMKLEQCGLDPTYDIYYSNATMCWPNRVDGGKEAAKDQALAACRGRLRHVLAQFDDDVPVVALGKWAQQALGLEVKERWEQEELTWKWAIAVLHPAAALYRPTQTIMFEYGVEKAVRGWTNVELDFTGITIDPHPLPDLNQNFGRVCVDIEATGKNWRTDHIFMVGISTENWERWIFTDEYLQQGETQAWLRALFAQHGAEIGGHNFKFDTLFMNRQFGTQPIVGWDTIAMCNVLHEHWYKDLKSLSTYYFDAPDYAENLVHSWLRENIKKKADRTFDKVPRPQMIEYLGYDIVYNLALSYELEEELRTVGRWQMPYQGHEVLQVNMLAKAEKHGMCVDLDQLEVESEVMAGDIALLTEQVQQLSDGHILNPGSYKQVGDYLFGILGIPIRKRTPKGDPCTDADVLRRLAPDYPIAQAIQAVRRVLKLKSSYVDNLPQFIEHDKYDQPRVHPLFKFWNVVTYRLAAEKPAVQTIPHKDTDKDEIPDWLVKRIGHKFDADYGLRIKKLFVAPPGHTLVAVDGRAWEVACATAQSKDEFLAAAFREDRDPHGTVCDMLFGPGWTKAQRVREKNIFFGGALYGGKAPGLAAETGLPLGDVVRIMEWFDENLTGIKVWRRAMFEQAKQGHIDLPFLKYRFHFDLINGRTLKDLARIAVNYPTQGLGSMLISRAAIIAQPYLEKMSAHIVCLVHDSFMAEVPDTYVDAAVIVMLNAVSQAGNDFSDFIPWRGDAEVSKKSWGDMEAYKV